MERKGNGKVGIEWSRIECSTIQCKGRGRGRGRESEVTTLSMCAAV